MEDYGCNLKRKDQLHQHESLLEPAICFAAHCGGNSDVFWDACVQTSPLSLSSSWYLRCAASEHGISIKRISDNILLRHLEDLHINPLLNGQE